MAGREPRSEQPARPSFGMSHPPFGLSKGAGHRVELMFALRSGGTIAAFHDLGSELTEESFERYVRELRDQVASGKGVATFSDAWSATGGQSWVNLAEVIAFSARPVR
jgi:hypothetical protein